MANAVTVSCLCINVGWGPKHARSFRLAKSEQMKKNPFSFKQPSWPIYRPPRTYSDEQIEARGKKGNAKFKTCVAQETVAFFRSKMLMKSPHINAP